MKIGPIHRCLRPEYETSAPKGALYQFSVEPHEMQVGPIIWRLADLLQEKVFG